MSDPRVEKLAELLVNYSVSIKKGDRVAIQAETTAAPLIRAVYAKVLQAGGHPFLLCSLAGLDEIFYGLASEEQLKHIPSPTQLIYETFDARIVIIGDENTKALNNVDPQKIVIRQRARAGLMKTFLERAAKGEFRWTVAPFPTNGYAQDAEMSLN